MNSCQQPTPGSHNAPATCRLKATRPSTLWYLMGRDLKQIIENVWISRIEYHRETSCRINIIVIFWGAKIPPGREVSYKDEWARGHVSSHQWRHISGKPLHTTLFPPAPPNMSTPLRVSCDIRKQQLITDSLLLLLFNHFYASHQMELRSLMLNPHLMRLLHKYGAI